MIFIVLRSVLLFRNTSGSDPTPSDDCDYTGQVRLAFRYSDSTLASGVLEICVNGTYLRVCGNDSFSQVDIDELAGFACSALGYPANREPIHVQLTELLLNECLYML